MLGRLDRFLAARGVDLVVETFAAWCLTLQHLASNTRRARMRIVRNLCLYRRRVEPDCFVPDERLFPPVHQAIRPHIFTDNEIVRLLAATRTLTRRPNSPLRPENLRLATVVLSTTGLRRGELTRLDGGRLRPAAAHAGDPRVQVPQVAPRPAVGGYRPRDRAPDRDSATGGDCQPGRRLRSSGTAGPPTGGYSGGSFGQAMRALFQRAGDLHRGGASSRAPMTFATHSPSTRSSGGTAPDSTCRRSCPSSPPTWGTSRSSRPPTTSSSSNRSRPWPTRDSQTTAAASSRGPPAREVRDDRRRAERPRASPPGVLRRPPAPGEGDESPHYSQLSGQPRAPAALRR